MPEQMSFPLTEPHAAPIFDTGPHPGPLMPRGFGDVGYGDVGYGEAGYGQVEEFPTDVTIPPLAGAFPIGPMVVRPLQGMLPGLDDALKRWQLALIVGSVWLLAAPAGLGFYYWWYTSMNKTAAIFGVLMYLMVCVVGSLLTSLVPNKPQVAAVAVGLMSAPLASVAAAAVLHGSYYFEWIVRPTVG